MPNKYFFSQMFLYGWWKTMQKAEARILFGMGYFSRVLRGLKKKTLQNLFIGCAFLLRFYETEKLGFGLGD